MFPRNICISKKCYDLNLSVLFWLLFLLIHYFHYLSESCLLLFFIPRFCQLSCIMLWESVLFLFVFLFIHIINFQYLSFCILSCSCTRVPSHVFVFMFDLSPNTSRVCVCTIWLFRVFWYIHWTAFTSRFLNCMLLPKFALSLTLLSYVTLRHYYP